MPYAITTATKKIASLSKRIKAIQGGTSAGKTIGTIQVLIDKCQRDGPGDVTSIVSESLPHLKRGAMRDFLNIMQGHNYFDDSRWNRSDFTYTFETGAILEFFSVDQPSKVRGPRRKRGFGNEINNFSLETFEQLEVRTLEEFYIDWNPTNEFWFYDYGDGSGKGLKDRDDVEHIILTYKDNEALDQNIVNSIEQRKNRKGWWQVYGLGQLGEVDGKIYKGWEVVDDIPHEARLERIGVDFGYSNDPSAIVAIYKYNGGYILDEIEFTKGLSNKQIADTILNVEKTLVIADSAEPKSIDEIRTYGVTILPAEKGKDSVNNGIQLVQDQKISVTRRSFSILNEYRNYLWETDKEGRILNIPEHRFSHSMDAIRYALTSLVKRGEGREAKTYYPSSQRSSPRKMAVTRHQGQ